MFAQLKNKKILIVGGTGGIGLAVSRLALDAGAESVIAARSSEKLNTAAQAMGARISTAVLDATDEEAVAGFFQQHGPLDHLVATIKPKFPAGAVLESDSDAARAALDAKFWGQYYLAKHGARHIRTGGSIVLTSGVASMRAYRGYAMVGAINAAVEALGRTLAVELAPIRINTVSPGFVDDQQPNSKRLEYVRNVAPGLPLDRLAMVDEVAAGYLHLMSNTYSTGTTLVIDGGVTCL